VHAQSLKMSLKNVLEPFMLVLMQHWMQLADGEPASPVFSPATQAVPPPPTPWRPASCAFSAQAFWQPR